MFLNKLYKDDENKNDRYQGQKKLMQISESYKNVRSNLMFAMAGKKSDKAKIIMVTSAEPGEGKTTSCVNLASVFAEANAKVLVIDADLRRPKVERYITDKRISKGLSDVLGGFSKLEDVIFKPRGCNFDCIFSGNIPPNPSELLMLDTAEEVFKTLSEEYDYIFVDTPPVGIVSETLYLTQFVSGVIVVVKKQQTRINKVKEVLSTLEFANANILGFIVNGSSNASVRRYYKRGKYYYKQNY